MVVTEKLNSSVFSKEVLSIEIRFVILSSFFFFFTCILKYLPTYF